MAKKKWVKHVHKEGSRRHVVYYDTSGAHCSHPNCEINKPSEPTSRKRMVFSRRKPTTAKGEIIRLIRSLYIMGYDIEVSHTHIGKHLRTNISINVRGFTLEENKGAKK